MDTTSWFILVGALFLGMGLTGESFKRLPMTSAMVYLAVGIVIGPTVLGLFHFNPLKQSALLEVITEIAVLLSLFTAGMKLPTRISLRRWRTPLLLAFVSMALCVACIALFSHYLLALSWGAAVLLGAILSPTDPVLATDVQLQHPNDRNRLRFNLTCEAGINDGSAFPFVMLGLGLLGVHELGDLGIDWLVKDLIWATVGGILVGVLAGVGLAYLIYRYRPGGGHSAFWDDFIALGLGALVYGISQVLGFWGFLSVFFAGVALRYAESWLIIHKPRPVAEHNHGLADRVLNYQGQLERLSELVLILLVGGTLFVDSWSWNAVALALFVFFVARPLAVWIGLLPSRSPRRLKLLMGWFGVRGIGSLYYLMYAIENGISQSLALQLIQFTLIVITLSILLHGITVKPVLNRYGYGHSNKGDRDKAVGQGTLEQKAAM
jgi:NhaP-type Na+/H+ or K+/H+ antiporter